MIQKTDRARLRDGEITNTEYRKSLALKNGFENFNEYENYLVTKKRGFKNRHEYENYLAIKRGFKNTSDYRNSIAIKRGYKNTTEYRESFVIRQGFKNMSEYCVHHNHEIGKNKPMSENKECSSYLGVYIAERYLSKIFTNVIRMPINHSGYDFICNKDYKIDVKSACIGKTSNRWVFCINNNITADYFLCIGFDNRNDMNPLHIWLIPNNTSLPKSGLSITNTSKILKKYQQYEQNEKLDELIICCDDIHILDKEN